MTQKKTVNHVLLISAVIVAVFVAFGAAFPDLLGNAANMIFSVLTDKFGWFYLITVFLMVIFAVFIAVSPMGKLKLGKPEDKPEFSDFQWFTMLFGGSMGIGLVFYSVAEPLMDYVSPPTAEPETAAAMYESMETVFFHWGFHPWVIFAIGGLALGYFSFKKDILSGRVTEAVPAATPQRNISAESAPPHSALVAAATIASPAPAVELTATFIEVL